MYYASTNCFQPYVLTHANVMFQLIAFNLMYQHMLTLALCKLVAFSGYHS
jgi:hypothetical protein